MDAYENKMVEARVTFANRINKLIPLANKDNLGFFVIYYTSLSAALHQPMEKIFKKASKRCQKMHFPELAQALNVQARLESEQSQEMKNDAEILIEWWNQKRDLDLIAKGYLHHPTMPSMQAWFDLHEDVVKHQSPFAELAMNYELQRTQTIHSFSLIKLAILKLGFSALRKLSFVRRAARLQFDCPLNKKLLTDFLIAQPKTLFVMTDKAQIMLTIYTDFIEDCVKLADNEAKKYQLVRTVA